MLSHGAEISTPGPAPSVQFAHLHRLQLGDVQGGGDSVLVIVEGPLVSPLAALFLLFGLLLRWTFSVFSASAASEAAGGCKSSGGSSAIAVALETPESAPLQGLGQRRRLGRLVLAFLWSWHR